MEERSKREEAKERKEWQRRSIEDKEKGRSPLVEATPPVTSKTSSVELVVHPTQPSRKPPPEKSVVTVKSQEKTLARLGNCIKQPPYACASSQPRLPPATPQRPLSSPHRREQNPSKNHCRRSPLSPEKLRQAACRSSTAAKNNKQSTLGPLYGQPRPPLDRPTLLNTADTTQIKTLCIPP